MVISEHNFLDIKGNRVAIILLITTFSQYCTVTIQKARRSFRSIMAIHVTTEISKRIMMKGKLKDKTDKPKRPLSAYNLFFQHERAKILQTASQPSYKPRRSHGKIGFADLARSVADKWKSLDESVKGDFISKAAVEKKRYEQELEVWNQARVAKMTACQKSPLATPTLAISNHINDDKVTIPYSSIDVARHTPIPVNSWYNGDVRFDDTLNILETASRIFRNSSTPFSINDCNPLTLRRKLSIDELISNFDEECLEILSALKHEHNDHVL